MKGRLILALLLSLICHGVAHGQNVQQLCLEATSSGDAIINCHKASYLVQQRQLEVIVELRNKLLLSIARSASQTVTNTASIVQRLEALENSIAKQTQSSRNFFYVSDLSNFSGRTVTCSQPGRCQEDATAAAHAICQRLGFESQNAYEATPLDNTNGQTAELKWVVCR